VGPLAQEAAGFQRKGGISPLPSGGSWLGRLQKPLAAFPHGRRAGRAGSSGREPGALGMLAQEARGRGWAQGVGHQKDNRDEEKALGGSPPASAYG